jgi:hypothetical protein
MRAGVNSSTTKTRLHYSSYMFCEISDAAKMLVASAYVVINLLLAARQLRAIDISIASFDGGRERKEENDDMLFSSINIYGTR